MAGRAEFAGEYGPDGFRRPPRLRVVWHGDGRPCALCSAERGAGLGVADQYTCGHPAADGHGRRRAAGRRADAAQHQLHLSIPPAWQTVPFGPAIIIAAPLDANSDTGPSVTLVGGAQNDLLPNVAANATLDDQLNSYVNTWFNYGSKAQLSNRRDLSMNGAPACSADLKWSTDKYDGFVGRIVMAQPSAGQVFLMVGGGTPEKWPTIIPVMDALLGSVRFNR